MIRDDYMRRKTGNTPRPFNRMDMRTATSAKPYPKKTLGRVMDAYYQRRMTQRRTGH